MPDLITDFGAVGDGIADDTLPLRTALASGQPIEVRETAGFYKLTGAIALPAGAEIIGRGRPVFKGIGRIADAIFSTAGDGVLLRDLILDGDKASKVNVWSWALELAHSGAVIENVQVRETKTRGIRITGNRNTVRGGSIVGTNGPGLQIIGGWGNTADKIDLSGNAGFGCHLDQSAHDNILDGLKAFGSGLELVGLTYSCYRNHLVSCHAEDTGDNGYSLTGYENIMSNCLALRCRYNGIRLYGSRNTITNNIFRDNGQRYLTDPSWRCAGIMISNGWGGLSSDNVVVGNICLDTQAAKSQAWGIRVGRDVHAKWVAAKVTAIGAYVSFGLNIYKAATAGTTGSAAPTHTAGTVSDGGVDWLCVTSATGNLDPQGNVVQGNVARGNWLADTVVETPNPQDVRGFDWTNGKPLWFTSAGAVNALGAAA